LLLLVVAVPVAETVPLAVTTMAVPVVVVVVYATATTSRLFPEPLTRWLLAQRVALPWGRGRLVEMEETPLLTAPRLLPTAEQGEARVLQAPLLAGLAQAHARLDIPAAAAARQRLLLLPGEVAAQRVTRGMAALELATTAVRRGQTELAEVRQAGLRVPLKVAVAASDCTDRGAVELQQVLVAQEEPMAPLL
jgi:hypothetical protein